MEINLDELEPDTLVNESKMHLVIERIVNGLYQNSAVEEDFLSFLNEEEEVISSRYSEEEDITSLLAKSKLNGDIDFVFKNAISAEETSFLNSLIIQLSLKNPHLIVFTDSSSSVSELREDVIGALEVIKENWNEYAKATGEGDFLEFANYIINDSDYPEDIKESIRVFGIPYISFDYFNTYHLTMRPILQESRLYNQHEKPGMFIWLPSDPDFKLIVEFEVPYYYFFPDETDNKDSILKSEGFQVIRYDEVDIMLNPLECANKLYKYLLTCSKLRAKEQKNSGGINQQRAYTQTINTKSYKTVEQWLDGGTYHYEDQRYLEALAAYQQAIRIDPNHANAYVCRGHALSKLNRHTEAIVAFEKAIHLAPNDALPYTSKGYVLLNLNRHTEALAMFEEAIHHEPNNTLAYAIKGKVLFKLKRYLEAIDTFEQIIQLEPHNAHAYNHKGEVLLELNEYEDAIVAFEQAIHLNPNDPVFHNNKGEVFSYLKRYPEALEDYEQAIRLDPNYTIAYNNKGHALAKLKRYSEALSDFEQAIHLNPNYVKVYNNKGNVLLELERHSEALAAYEESIRLAPNDTYGYLGKGNVLIELKQYNEALIVCQLVINLDPNNAIAYYNRGNILAELERYSEALSAYEEAIRLNPEEPIFYNNKGEVLSKLDRPLEAMAAFEKALLFKALQSFFV